MKQLTEIRFHGRGGQGAKTGAVLLAQAAMKSGRCIQAFPEYGPERAGAPVRAYTRISDDPIRLHCPVTEPDAVAVIDSSLINTEDVAEGLKAGVIVVNSTEGPDGLRRKTGIESDGICVAAVDADGIARETIGRPISNIALLGALAAITQVVDLDALSAAVKETLGGKIGQAAADKNVQAMNRAFKEVQTE
jgi:pyruvate ferredoxin oxidoreductase gamma subunit